LDGTHTPLNPIVCRWAIGVGITDVSSGLEGENSAEPLTGPAVLDLERASGAYFDLDELITHSPTLEPNAVTNRWRNPIAEFERSRTEAAKTRRPECDSREVYFVLVGVVTRGIESLLTSTMAERLYCRLSFGADECERTTTGAGPRCAIAGWAYQHITAKPGEIRDDDATAASRHGIPQHQLWGRRASFVPRAIRVIANEAVQTAPRYLACNMARVVQPQLDSSRNRIGSAARNRVMELGLQECTPGMTENWS
jgi:hypothetical protein